LRVGLGDCSSQSPGDGLWKRSGKTTNSLVATLFEKQVADDIDRMIEDDWLPFIDMVMTLGGFSAAFHHIVDKKNRVFFALCDAEMRHELDITSLKSKIEGYKNTIQQTRHTIKQLGNGMAADTYESDGSVKF
jgi:hypothetical protein